MVTSSVSPLIWSSLHAYLVTLRESGVDGIPADYAPSAPVESLLLHDTVNNESVDCELPEKHETIEQVRKGLGDCHRCKLAATRKKLVFGVGNVHARLVFVGEGPGADEDEKGEPFVGDAGRMLNRIIAAMGLARQDVYICNVVKCRPPQNRNPEKDEIAACAPFLLRQLHSVRPEVIVALGTFAAQTVLSTKEPISKLRGKFHDFRGVPLMPTYHPSYLLRSGGNSDSFWTVWDDMTQVLRLLKLPVPEKSRKK